MKTIGHYKAFQFKKDIPYWVSNFSDLNAIKGILRFKEDIKADALKGSKEAVCLLVDLENILKNIKLNKMDIEILKYYQSGFSNYDSEGKYWSDNELLSLDLKIDKEKIKKSLNKIFLLIYDYNAYLWSNTYCKIYRDWILKSSLERKKIIEESKKNYIKAEKKEISKLEFNLNNSTKKGFVYSALSELNQVKESLYKKKKKYEEDGLEKSPEYKKLINFYIGVCKDIGDIKRSLNIPVRKKQKRKIQKNDKTITIYPLEYLGEELCEENKTVLDTREKILAWQIKSIVEEQLTERQREIFIMKYFKGYKQKHIANLLKVSQQYVQSEIKNIKQILKKEVV